MKRSHLNVQYDDDDDEKMCPPKPKFVKQKVSKKSAGYIPAQVVDIRCETCRSFQSESNCCSIVKSRVAKRGCCNLWVATGTKEKIVFDFDSGKQVEDQLGF